VKIIPLFGLSSTPLGFDVTFLQAECGNIDTSIQDSIVLQFIIEVFAPNASN
jgi:hypothetical protein